MAEWLELPACRVYVVPHAELGADFDMLDENGKEAQMREERVFIVRKRDSKVFKFAKVVPANSHAMLCCYLEEV